MSDYTPPDTLTVKMNGKPKELFMSFGLLNELLIIVGDMANCTLIAINHELRSAVLHSVLSERDAKGGITVEASPFTTEVSKADIQEICGWVASHCLDFFLGAIETSVKTNLLQKERFKEVVPSTPSGTGSAS